MAIRLINRKPSRRAAILLAAIPFVLVLLAYQVGSDARLAENPSDKLLPAFSTIGDAIERMAFQPDRRTGDILLWKDTAASLERLGWGVLIATLITILIALPVGLLAYARSSLKPLVDVVAMVPPLAILPILFIIFGLGETAKIALIAIGITPVMIRDLILRIDALPTEQLVKAQTLGASSWAIAVRVALPQVMPRLLDSIRLSLGAAWLFLIAAEAIASQSGLGYRIFLMRRYLGMDVILPYVAWITLLAFIMDYALIKLRQWLYPWAEGERA